MLTNYPPSPKLENYDFLKPGSSFKKAAWSVVFSAITFLLLYLVLLAISLAVLGVGIFGGLGIITSVRGGIITLAIGAGLIALGIMFFFFMIKFLFSRTKDENPSRIRLSEKEYPQLFGFVRQLANETNTKMPKKIFITPDVNASVFYNSSFLSLFFPVRKNLQIGLGLVNALTVSELKSVLAHEFGHFSQKSMRLGSYIYTLNRVIYNLVFEYDNWDNLLIKWAETGGIFGFFAGITFWMVECVRSVLKLAYNFININYMKLSREMEYHADLVAVSVGGTEVFKRALRKIEFASFSYNYTLDYLNLLAEKGKASNNIYTNHKSCSVKLAVENKLAIKDQNIEISTEDLNRTIVKSRVNIEDQWASHPSLKERESNVDSVKITCETIDESSWVLFEGADGIQKETTKKLYEIGFVEAKEWEAIDDDAFVKIMDEELDKYRISENYNGFYDNRFLSEIYTGRTEEKTIDFDEVYGEKSIEFIKKHHSNKADFEILKQLSLKYIKTKFFEFDGEKCRQEEAPRLVKKMEREINLEVEHLKRLDKLAFDYHFLNAEKSGAGSILREKYKHLFSGQRMLSAMDEVEVKRQEFVGRLYGQPRWTEKEIDLLTQELNAIEKDFRNVLIETHNEGLQLDLEESQKEELKLFIDYEKSYTKTTDFDEEGLIGLSNMMVLVHGQLLTAHNQAINDLTYFQLEMMETSGEVV